MKNFLIKSAYFLSLVIITLIIGEVIVRKVENPYSTKDSIIKQHGRRYETLFLGNSHTFYGIRADLWPDSALNLGNVSQTIAYDCYLLEHYIDSLPNLKNIIMEVSLTSLYDDDMENTEEWWRCISYQLYNDTKRHPFFSKYSFELSFLPVYAGKLKTFLKLSTPNLASDSFGNGLGYVSEASERVMEITGPKHSSGHKKSSNLSLLPRNLRYLERIKNICKGKGINLNFFTQPHYKTYRESADTAYINRMKMEIERFSNIHNARYFDLYSDARFTKEDFFDADHLNHDNGAPKLTKILADSVFNN